MRLINATRPYEKVTGNTENLLEKWIKQAETTIFNGGYKDVMADIRAAIDDFDNLERIDKKKPKVGALLYFFVYVWYLTGVIRGLPVIVHVVSALTDTPLPLKYA